MGDEPEFVIGREMAAAVEAEEQRRATHGQLPSPLPSGGDRPWLDQTGLLRITPLPYDEALAAFARGYREASAERRAEVRDALGLDDAYLLLVFGRRASVFALRDRTIERVRDGLGACAAIAPERSTRGTCCARSRSSIMLLRSAAPTRLRRLRGLPLSVSLSSSDSR